MENTYMSRRQQQPSPRLLRSRSGTSSAPTLTLPQNVSRSCTTTPNNSQRFITPRRSKSTVKSRTNKNHEEEKVHALKQKKGGQEDIIIGQQGTNNFGLNTSFAKLQRGSTSPSPSPRPRISASVPSPSAWALSPGRSLPRKVTPDPPAATPSTRAARVKSSGGGLKKVPPIQEEDFHRFRILHNRLLQWRFANARGEAAKLATQKISQDKLFSVWLRTLKVRNFILDKRIQVQKVKHEIKVYQILNPQIFLLNEWGKLDKKKSRIHQQVGEKIADVASVYEAMTPAMAAMEGNLGMVSKLLPQLEKVLYMVTELLIAHKQQRDLDSNLALVSALAEEEASVRAHLIQLESMYFLPPNKFL
ncbi:QWRF motif-containing protein 7-like [Pyrus ussuriensis x Pyrus communis]|uniref:QWRF motif-containing protein 7-like n=1 Tax=Pyrus ussuriensis x Pyrus communis TaxID=2448454 RepID=A0A5N5F0M7_9ROSA|nr:QWRF motif-containing protein 7-like [Pyrus ussuriensis x Pyrus communis]